MATKTWTIEKDLCRCCHAEGAFDNLAEPRIFLEKEEVYSDMLKECLDIDIPPVPGELCTITYTICNACIVRLRDACNFKKQVQDCEQRFMTLYYKNAIQGIKPKTEVKEEVDVTLQDEHSDAEPDIVFKKEDEEGDDDHLMGGDDDDISDDDIPIKQSLLVMKTRPKPKPKPKAPPVKKEKPPPKPKKKEEPKKKETVKEKKGMLHVKRGRDYRKDADRYRCAYCAYSDQISNLHALCLHIRLKHFDVLKQRNSEGGRPEKTYYGEDYTMDGDKFRCAHCGRTYKRKDQLNSHIRVVHRGIYKFKCPFCDKSFKYDNQIQSHKLQEHNLDERIECKACDKKFYTRRTLTEHVQSFHMQGEKRKCPSCDFESYKLSSFSTHMKYSHKRDRDLECGFCKKTFIRLSTLRQHERIHKDDKRSICKVCDMAFVQKASLNYHMSKYHPEVNF